MLLKVFLLVCLVAGAVASRLSPAYNPQQEPQAPAHYDFEWGVQDASSGTHFGHRETRLEDDTRGSYFVLLPDGRTQRVTYYVDGDSGFIAKVEYDGVASTPTSYN